VSGVGARSSGSRRLACSTRARRLGRARLRAALFASFASLAPLPGAADDLPWGEPLAIPSRVGGRDELRAFVARLHDPADRPGRLVAATDDDARALEAWLRSIDDPPALLSSDDGAAGRCTVTLARGADLAWSVVAKSGPCLVRRPERRATLVEAQVGGSWSELGPGAGGALLVGLADAAGWMVGARLAGSYEVEAATGGAAARETRGAGALHAVLALRDGPAFFEVGAGPAAILGSQRAGGGGSEPYGPRFGGSLTGAGGVRFVGRTGWSDRAWSLALRYTALPLRGHVVGVQLGLGGWHRHVSGRERALAPSSAPAP
jgi:hypothetical protein